ncbi:hypothetical protein AB5N19_14300 [Seiridium cardinale]
MDATAAPNDAARQDSFIGLDNFTSSGPGPAIFNPLITDAGTPASASIAVTDGSQAESDALSEYSDVSSEASVESPPSKPGHEITGTDRRASAVPEKVLLVHIECSPHHFESVMDRLSRGINDMMIAGDIKVVRYSV